MMKEIDLTILKGAIFSDDRRYRYALWRIWTSTKPLLLFIGLNPSIASDVSDDPTVIRNMARASQNGFGGLLHANLYAFISTNPDALLKNDSTIGELTDYYLANMVKLSSRQLCGWGSFPPVVKRAPIVLAMLTEPYCLAINVDGQPKHPLYVSYDTPMVKYSVKREGDWK